MLCLLCVFGSVAISKLGENLISILINNVDGTLNLVSVNFQEAQFTE